MIQKLIVSFDARSFDSTMASVPGTMIDDSMDVPPCIIYTLRHPVTYSVRYFDPVSQEQVTLELETSMMPHFTNTKYGSE